MVKGMVQMAGADLRLSLLIRMSFRNRYVHRLTTVQGLHLHSGASAYAFICIRKHLGWSRTSNEAEALAVNLPLPFGDKALSDEDAPHVRALALVVW